MKKGLIVLMRVLAMVTLIAGVMCSCQQTELKDTETKDVKPIEAQLTYSFVPDSSGAHMFDIRQIGVDGSQDQVLLNTDGIGYNQPDWTSDGTTMAIWGWHSPEVISIYTYNTETQEMNRLTEMDNVYDMFPHWNASNDKIIFTRQYLLENDRNEIWTINADGSEAMKIVDGYTGSWSPDGKQIVYSHIIDGTEDLYTCNLDGSNVVKLLDSPNNESFPMWSPDGQSILFEQFESTEGNKDLETYEICLMKLSTGEVKALTQNDYLDSGARWSPDGLKIAFLSSAQGENDFEIYVMKADGTDVKQVTQTAEGSFSTFPSWRILPKFTRKEMQFGQGRSFGQCSGDLNGDSLLDVFVTTYEGQSELYLQTSSGFDLSPQQFSIPEDNSHDAACGDLDSDGDLDLFLVNNSKSSRIFFNDGKGTFESASESYGYEDGMGINVELADLDGDMDLDAILANYKRPVQILINDGKGVFETRILDAFKTETIQVLVADFNGDKALDLYLVNQDIEDQIALNDGNGAFALQPEHYGESESWGYGAAGDVNGDGFSDVVVANSSVGSRFWFNDGKGNLVKSDANFGLTSTYASMVDLDQDGDLDLIDIYSESGVALYLNQGSGNYKHYKTLETNSHAISSFVMDFDHDGHLDILVGHMTGGNVVYYYE